MGSVSSHTSTLLTVFSIGGGGVFCRQSGKNAVHGALYSAIAHELVGNIDEAEVYTQTFGQLIAAVVEAVCLTDTTTHRHTVYGMAQPLLGYGYEKCDRSVGSAHLIGTRYRAKGISQGTELCAAGPEKNLDGTDGTKFFLFTEAEFFHISGVSRLAVVAGEVEVEGGRH